jgi:hypothetical protein
MLATEGQAPILRSRYVGQPCAYAPGYPAHREDLFGLLIKDQMIIAEAPARISVLSRRGLVALERAPNSQPVHQAADNVRVNIKDGSRAVGPAHYLASSLKHSENMLAL